MLPSLGLWRPATRRSRAEWPVSLAAFLLLLCGTTLLAAGTLYAATVSTGGLRRSVADAPAAGRAVVVRASTSTETAAAADPVVRAAIAEALDGAAGTIARVARVVTFAPGAGPDDDVRRLLTIEAADGIADHASLLDGRWPAPGATPVEVAVPAVVAERLGLAVGDRLTVPGARAGSELELTVVGRWQPTDPSDAYWLADPLDLEGEVATSTEVTLGPLIVAPGDLDGRVAGGSIDVQWRGLVDPGSLVAEDLPGLRASLGGMTAALARGLPDGPGVSVATDLPGVLEAVERSVLVSRSGILLLTIQFAVLAGYAVLLVAGMLAERRRAEVALLRARGAGGGHVALIAFLEGLLLAVPAALLAPLLAVGIVRLLGVVGPLAQLGITDDVTVTPDVVVVSFVAAAVYLLALTLPAAASMPALAGVRASLGRQVGRTLPQRLGIDIALVVLAVIAIWQLRLYGAPLTRTARGTLGIDPLLVAAPAIGLLAGVLLAARLVPRLAEVGERLVGRRRSLVGPLSAQQIARRPLRYTRSAMLLMLAAALGTFAAAQAATWSRSQSDQAAYRAAEDVRLVASASATTPTWALGSSYRAIDGVIGASPVSRQVLDVGRAVRSAELVGLDPDSVASAVRFTGDDANRVPEVLRQLPGGRPDVPAVAIDGSPVRLAVEVDARLATVQEAPPDQPLPPDAPVPGTPSDPAYSWDGVIPTLVVVDGDGWVQRIDLARGRLGGGVQRLEGSLETSPDGRPANATGPLRLVGVELRLTAPLGVPAVDGTVALRRVLASDDGTAWRDVPVDPGAPGWSWDRSDAETSGAPYRPPDGQAGTIVLGTTPRTAPPISGVFVGDPGSTFRLRATPAGGSVLPAVASRSFMDATGAEVGDQIAGQSEGQDLSFEIAGVAETFPPLDPATPFLVVDGPSLQALRYATLGATTPPDEWWFTTAAGRSGDVAAALRTGPAGKGDVIDREGLARELSGDPVALGVVGALGLGALAALAFAAIGFVVGATISAGERIGEFALLRALGLSSGGLSVSLTIENAFLLVTGLATGVTLGLVLAWIVLPVSTLTPAGETPVPSPVVVVPWEAILPVLALTAVLLVLAVVLAVRQLPGARVSGALRAWEG